MNNEEGFAQFTVQGELYSTWFKVVGSLSSPRRPLVVVHGGPGISHDYMIPLVDLASFQPPIPVVLYDQTGSARSTHPDLLEKDSSFWTIELFVAELEKLLAHLSISSYDLFGHSWGATLISEFAIRSQPEGLNRLILSSSLASAKLRNDSISRLRKTLPVDIQAALHSNEVSKTTYAPEYKRAMRVFHENFGCRINPPPREVTFSLSQVELEGRVVQKGMCVYFVHYDHAYVIIHLRRENGMADQWSIIEQIPLIRVPTLVTNCNSQIQLQARIGDSSPREKLK